jgi:NADP-dependent 3-hydroxy acid dehydrogenase YdfG
VVLAARPTERLDTAAARLDRLGTTVVTLPFDAADTASHPALVEKAFADGDIDVTLVTFGLLGDQEKAWTDHATAVELAQVNYVGATAGLKAATLSVTPEQVAEVIVDTGAKGREQAGAPAPMRFVMSALRHVPRPIFRRLPV